MKKLYLVDISSFFFRAYYAIPPLNTSKGVPTNALHGVLSMTVKLLKNINPDYIAFCFDRKEKSFRFDLYPEYKANRGEMPEDLIPQVPYLRKMAEVIGIPTFDKLGYEADDVIGSLCRFGQEQGLEVVIVSGDKDFTQLIGPRVTMYDSMKNKLYDEQAVIDKWGVAPEQMIDYLSIVGDSSDNIPGIKGIGPKGAQKLLAEYKDLEGIFSNSEKISGKSMKQKVQEGEDKAYLSKELVIICDDIDFGIKLSDLEMKKINKDNLIEFLGELEFTSFSKSLLGEASEVKTPVADKKTSNKTKKIEVKSTKDKSSFSEESWSLAQLDEKVKPYNDCYGILTERGLVVGYENQAITVEAEPEEVGKVLGKKNLNWKGFNLKEFWKRARVIEPSAPTWDSMLAAYVVRAGNIESFRGVHDFYLGGGLPDLPSAVDYYCGHLNLEEALKKKLQDVNGEKVFSELELPLVPVLYDMEQKGIFVDKEILSEKSQRLEADINSLQDEIIEIAGEPFNIASPKQLGEVLFNKMGLEGTKKTKTGYSTSSDVLLKLNHPIAKKIIEFRELSKLKSTYVDALPQLINEKTGKIHTSFRQAATATGRLSSVNPNLQNIPIRTERGRHIRSAFVAEKEHLFLSVDYSQIELRVLAHITGDKALCNAFAKDIDIHAATASEVFGVDLDDVTPELRRKAKAVNFGIAYGQGVYGLSESLGIPRAEASEIIGNYFGKFKKVKEYMESVVDQAKEEGFVEAISGRRRYIDELKSKNGNMRKFGERAAINAPIQGAASDLVKKAMIDVYQSLDCDMLLQVHDELLFESPKEDIEELALSVKEIMEGVEELNVPLKVNVAWGSNWEEAHA